MAWKDCQTYMRAIHDLRDELSRELDVVQTNNAPRQETLVAALNFRSARITYLASLKADD